MATTKAATFSSMINQYLAYSDILMEEFKKQNWLLENCNMKGDWQGGELIVPFQQSFATSVRMGALTADTDIDEATYVRGSLPGYKECYGSLKFNSRDLFIDHYKISEQSFLKVLPEQIEQTMKWMKQLVSIQVLQGPYLDTVSAAFDEATDVLAVNHPERFMVGQKIVLFDGVTTVTGYVRAIDKNTGIITATAARTGPLVPALDLALLIEADTKVYIDGGETTSFGSLRSMLLPAALGGSDSFAGVLKSSATFAQSVQYDAGGLAGTGDWGTTTAVTFKDILALCFDAHRKGAQLGAEPKTFVMSYKNYSACLKSLEVQAGAFKNVDPAVVYAGYSSVKVGGVGGVIELVGIREFADDWIAGLNKQYLDFHHGRRPFSILTSPDGLKYYTIRGQNGYVYVTDICLAGDFLYSNPWSAVAIHSIPPYANN